jgi:hypothetical protein
MISFEVWPDCVLINGDRVARPAAIARSRWLAYWEAVARVTRGDEFVQQRSRYEDDGR